MNIKAVIKKLRICIRPVFKLLPIRLQRLIWLTIYGRIDTSFLLNSNANKCAIQAIVNQRCEVTGSAMFIDPLIAKSAEEWPAIDISVVTYNSSRWVEGLVDSLLSLDYPKDKLTVYFVDNSSTDDTLSVLQAVLPQLISAGCKVEVIQQPNHGFGAGHNAAIRMGAAPFCLVTNIDLSFEHDALACIVATACADVQDVAAWELRQKPYEHPKFYDPVTGLTNWNSHACVLLRRSAFELVGGYDENIFMYGEDVELSYRLRQSGYLLRYCPKAVVFHYTYDSAAQIKPLQYTGSTFANLYIRLKYGQLKDILVIPLLMLSQLAVPQVFPGSRKALLQNFIKLISISYTVIKQRVATQAYFPFYAWDYDLVRSGAFVTLDKLADERPLVSIITRTYQGRSFYLWQAMLSVAHQTYPNVEYIVVEDGGETQKYLVEEMSKFFSGSLKFIGMGKVGRSATGNAGLAAATGRWCLFLDDDDLLFADHIEVLMNALEQNTQAVAAYTPAWEVVTDAAQIKQGKYSEKSWKVPHALQEPFDFNTILERNLMAIQSVLFERSLFLQRGGFEEDMDALEDWVLWATYAFGNQFVYVSKVTSLFRTPADSGHVRKRIRFFSDAYPIALARIRAKYSVFQSEHNAKRTLIYSTCVIPEKARIQENQDTRHRFSSVRRINQEFSNHGEDLLK